ILYSSHYMEEVEKICDDIAFLDKGQILIEEKIDTLLQTHSSPTLFVKWKEDVPLNRNALICKDVQDFKDGYLITYDRPVEVMEHMLNYLKQHDLTLEKLELIQPS